MKILVTDRHAADTEEIEIAAAGDGIEVAFSTLPRRSPMTLGPPPTGLSPTAARRW